MYFTRAKFLQTGHHFVKNNQIFRVTEVTQRSIHYYRLLDYKSQNGNYNVQSSKQTFGKNSSEIVLYIDKNEIPIYFGSRTFPIPSPYHGKF